MDSFELNKIFGAILGTLLFVMGLGFLAQAIYHPIEDRGPGYMLAEAEAAPGGEEDAGPVLVADLGTLMASADVSAGEAAARKCTGCHNFVAGAGNKQGPELYEVVNRLVGSHEGFAYSDILLEHRDSGDVWSYENLSAFLLSPRGYAPGTKMAFPGIKDDAERANVLAYLGSLSASPVAFPAPAAAEAQAEAAPAADTPAADAPATEAPAAEAPASEAPAADPAPATDAAPAADAAPAVETPTTTDSETMVEGTPISETPQTVTPVQ